MEQEKIPQVISESEIEIGDLKIRGMVLDDGQRIVPEEDFEKVIAWLTGRACNEWIKCSDRMPDKNQGCLTWNGIHIGKSFFSFGSFQCWQPEKITHWQPLPAPPQD